MLINGGLSAFKGKRVLLLQGPLGPFFNRLASDLKRAGATVIKINFNGGDWLFFSKGSIAFRGRHEEWPAFLERVLVERQIDTVLLFGDCRPLHVMAREIAIGRGIGVGVFEEGYVRPDYITLEQYGVNGYSTIPRNPKFYLNGATSLIPQSIEVRKTFWHAAWWAILYYQASAILWPIFRHYEHHRPLTIWEGLYWLRSAWYKYYFSRKEKGAEEEMASTLVGRYFLVPLQVHNDSQLYVHSNFESVEVFIEFVIASFAKFAPADTHLFIKHHPMDRGHHNYSQVINDLVEIHSVHDRVRYIHDQHLPTLLEHARGVVLVNSTVGLSALHHATPLMVCGDAIYDIPGLTFQGALDEFWNEANISTVDTELYLRFRNYLIKHTQLNGNFYRRLNIANSCTGMIWPTAIEEQVIADTENDGLGEFVSS